METKICTKCKVEKPIASFTTRKLRSGYIRPYSWCNSCNVAHVKEWQKNNRERSNKSIHLRTRPYLIHRGKICERCGFIADDECQLDVDHKDDNHKNNDPSNLVTLCANCHRLKSKARQIRDPVRKNAWLERFGFIPNHGMITGESTSQETGHVDVRSEGAIGGTS